MQPMPGASCPLHLSGVIHVQTTKPVRNVMLAKLQVPLKIPKPLPPDTLVPHWFPSHPGCLCVAAF